MDDHFIESGTTQKRAHSMETLIDKWCDASQPEEVHEQVFETIAGMIQENKEREVGIATESGMSIVEMTTGAAATTEHQRYPLHLTIQELVGRMEEPLTSSDDKTRHRATLLLANLLHLDEDTDAVENSPSLVHLVNPAVVHLFVVFFTHRLSDYPSLAPSLHALLALVSKRRYRMSFDPKYEDGSEILNAIFRLPLPGLAQSVRQKALEVMDAVFNHDDDACPPLITLHNDSDSSSYALSSSPSSYGSPLSSPDEQSPDLQLALATMQGLLACVQGEKDPRCLVLSLRIIRRAMRFFTVPLDQKSGSSSALSSSVIATNEDEISVTMGRVFESLACYFPITFTPPEDDPHGITPQQLQRALFEALVAHRGQLPHLLPFLLTQLTGTRASADLIDPEDEEHDPQATNATAQIQAMRVLVLLVRGQGLGHGLGSRFNDGEGSEGMKREDMFLSLLAAAMFALGMTATTSPSSSSAASSSGTSHSGDDLMDGGGDEIGGVALWAITELCRSLTTGYSTGTKASARQTGASTVKAARARVWRVIGEEGIIARCLTTVLPQNRPRAASGGGLLDVDGLQGRAAVTILLAVAQGALMPCRAVTSRLLPPLLDLIITTTNTKTTSSKGRASPCPRAVASGLQALHRLLCCIAERTRASEVGVDTTRLGPLHPLHGLDFRALGVLLDMMQSSDKATDTATSDSTASTAVVTDASASATPYPQALSLHQLAAPLPSAPSSAPSPGVSAGGVLAGALLCLRALIASTSSLTLSSSSNDVSASDGASVNHSDMVSPDWRMSLVCQTAHIAVMGRRQGDSTEREDGGAGEEEVGHVKAAALGLLAELLAQDNGLNNDSGVDCKEGSASLVDVCMDTLSQYLSSSSLSELSRKVGVALAWSLSAVQAMSALAVATIKASYQHSTSAQSSSSVPSLSLRMLHLALPYLLHTATATVKHSTTSVDLSPDHRPALGLSALQALVSLLPGETQDPGLGLGLTKGLGSGLGWNDSGSNVASSEAAATAIALQLIGNLLDKDIRARASSDDSSTDGAPILALLHFAILHNDATTTVATAIANGGALVGQIVRRLLLALVSHATQPNVAQAIVVYILELEKSTLPVPSSSAGRGVVVLSLLSSALCHLRPDSFQLATTSTADPHSPLSIVVVERMTSLALTLITNPTPGSDASNASGQGMALLAHRLPPSLALDALMTRVHALLTPSPEVEGEAEVVMGVYVGVMKALLMRNDVRMTTSDGTGAGVGTSCWQDRFVVSLLSLWNTSSTSPGPSTDTDTTNVSTSGRFAWAAALTGPIVFQQSPSSSPSSSTAVPLLWRQRAWSRLAHPLLALASVQEQPSQPSSLSQCGLLALCGMIVALGQSHPSMLSSLLSLSAAVRPLVGLVLTTLQTHLTGSGGLNSDSISTSMGVVCVQTLTLLLSENWLAEHVVPHLALVAALLVKASQACPSLPAHGRQSALQGLLTLASLPDRLTPQVCPYSRIYPVRTAVVRGLGRALDDRKRAIRRLAAKVRNTWLVME